MERDSGQAGMTVKSTGMTGKSYMNNVLVIKCSGSLAMGKKWTTPLFQAIKELLGKKFYIVIVHGGGQQADDLANQLNVPIKKFQGKRITDENTLQIVKMTHAGLINTDLVSSSLENGVAAVGISGVSSKIAEVIKRPLKKSVDFGYVGDIQKINKKLIKLLLRSDYVPIISCLGVDNAGQVFNINADRLAAHIAVKLKAKKLIFISDVQGIAADKNKNMFISKLDLRQAEELVEKGIITDGMIPKVESAFFALKKEVSNVQIVGRFTKKEAYRDAILQEKYGTVMTKGEAYV